jgi:eukaryotic-like serine/threonine-protein kinase
MIAGGDDHYCVRVLRRLGSSGSIAVLREVAEGVRFAASGCLIHRRFEPANLLRAPNRHVKIIYLSLSLLAEYEYERVTREGTIVGSVELISPEQARNRRATCIRSDVYSLGRALDIPLDRFPAVRGGNIARRLIRHCCQPPPEVRRPRSEVPGPLSLLNLRMIAKRPDSRLNTV